MHYYIIIVYLISIFNKFESEESMTPIDQIIIQGEKYLLKREDLNPTGSHKDRGVFKQIELHLEHGAKGFVISSSGNSAISATYKCIQENIPLTIFISEKISARKLKRLSEVLGAEMERGLSTKIGKISIIFSRKAISDAFRFSEENSLVNLRGSVDPLAIEGYTTIADELLQQNSKITDIFIPSSSGTSAYGIYTGYKRITEDAEITIPRFQICQTSAVHTLVKDLTNDLELKSEHSIVDSIVDRVGHRREQIKSIIEDTEGKGWVIPDKEVLHAESQDILMKNFSYESALALASAMRFVKSNDDELLPLILISSVR